MIFDEEVDVLVVGSGLAGLSAALGAEEAGARVAIVTPKRLGRDSSSAMSTGGVAASFHDNGDDPTLHMSDTLISGQGIACKQLVENFCFGSAPAVTWARNYGAKFVESESGLSFSSSAEHSIGRNLAALHSMGTSYTVPLAEQVRTAHIHVAEFHTLFSIVKDSASGEVVGAELLDLKSQRPRTIAANAVVLAPGGAGQLFPTTSNPIDLYGAGYSIGLRAGASLRDMEFVQFYPYRCIGPFNRSRVAIQPSTFTAGGKLYNRHNERFMPRYDPVRSEATTRDVAARSIYMEIAQQRDVGGGVRLDLSALSRQDMIQTNPRVVRALDKLGIDHRTYDFVITPEAHYFMGGLSIDTECQTGVPGLFSAGESAGGIHGANRLTNNSLSEALVFGRRAGHFSALYSLERGARRRTGNVLESICHRAPGGTRSKESVDLSAIQNLAWSKLGIVRNGPDLLLAIETLAVLEEIHNRDSAEYLQNRPRWLRTRCLIDTARVIALGALTRQESRGAHYRSDATDARTTYERPIQIFGAECSEGKMQLATRLSAEPGPF